MQHKPNINNFFFTDSNDAPPRMTQDVLAGERRALINRHKDGEITAKELQAALRQLKHSDNQ